MYLKQLEFVNTGPIEQVHIKCQFREDGSPKPIILVGQNGSGKSIITAHIVSALISAHTVVFDDSDVEKGKVYKLRSPSYIRSGAHYSYAELQFSNNFSVYEAHLDKEKKDFLEPFPSFKKWAAINDDQHTYYSSNFTEKKQELNQLLNNATHIFFPPNRFEEPAWLNEMNLINKVNYPSIIPFVNISNRPVVSYSPMRDLQSWLLDLIYDSNAVEKQTLIVPAPPGSDSSAIPTIYNTKEGPATNIIRPVEEFFRSMFGREGVITWSIGARNRRQIGISINGEMITKNLFQLSTGQVVLIDMFLAIIRDFDLSHSEITKLADIQGIVVIDEIDLHLHIDLQLNLLPRLIHLFPRVQFILTTHSPLFLIGMERIFTAQGFQLLELPSGHEIEVERFSEFEAAYTQMQKSKRFEEDVRSRIEETRKMLLCLEGATDIDYLTKAGELLGRSDLVDKFEILDAGGVPNLNKLWDTFRGHLNNNIKNRTILLYDCDARKADDNKGELFIRTIRPYQHKIDRGIENLFSDSVIEKAMSFKSAFVDVKTAHSISVRGVKEEVPESWEINRDEKRNLCDWMCANGTKEDFKNFDAIFDIIQEVVDFVH